MPHDPSNVAWAPSLSCRTWNDAHRTAAAMYEGGVLLRTETPPPIGAGVHLTLRLPDGTDVVLQGDVLDVRADEGAVVRFRVAMPILSQLESRAFGELHSAPRPPSRPLARGSLSPEDDAEAGTTYSIVRRKRK